MVTALYLETGPQLGLAPGQHRAWSVQYSEAGDSAAAGDAAGPALAICLCDSKARYTMAAVVVTSSQIKYSLTQISLPL